MDDETLKVYGYVISSSYREKSVKSLNKSNKIPTDLECINEEKRKNRVYRLTSKGEDVANLLD